jgi:hypothetical protein
MDNNKGIALIAGGFKPPTKGHYHLIKETANNPNISEVKVFIGNKIRDGITPQISKKIWEIYDLPKNVSIEISPTPSPVTSVYNFLKTNPDKKIYFVGGVRNKQDEIDLRKKTLSALKRYNNVDLLTIMGPPTVSGTKARKALLDRDSGLFFSYLCEDIDNNYKDIIWKELSSSQ